MSDTVFEPDGVYNVSDWIDEGKDLGISHDALCLKSRDGDVIIPVQTLVCRYYYALVPFTSTLTFTDEKYQKYKNNPKRLSQDLYETPELWSALLYINNTVSIADFKKRTIRIFDKTIIAKLEELMVLAEEDLTKNKLEIMDT